MLPFESKTVRFLARMGARGVLGQAVYDYVSDGNDLFAVSADLAHASDFDRLIRDYPDKVVNVGIAEQNLIGVSAGLSRGGIPVVATSWAMFTSARVADQVRNFMGYMQSNVKLIGMDSGFAQSRFSYSHSNPPDIAIMRAIPGITIISPCDGVEIYRAVYAALYHAGPVYIRLTGSGSGLLPIVYQDFEDGFQIGKANILREGTDAAIIACGNIVGNALRASDILKEKGISVKVVDMHTIAPLDREALDELKKYRLIVTAEEHLLHGGLGSAVAGYYADSAVRPKHIMLGVDNLYPAPGSIKYVEEMTGLLPRQIADQVERNLEDPRFGGVQANHLFRTLRREVRDMRQNVVITGASRGIGNALVKAFAGHGYNVWACIRKESDELTGQIEDLQKKYHVWIRQVFVELSDPQDIRRAFREIAAEKKRVDVLVNCAGVAHLDLFQMSSQEVIRNVYEVNLFALMQTCQLALRIMTRQKGGKIINVASTAADEVYVGNSIYGASKAAVVAFTKSLAAEAAGHGIQVNAVSPGLTDTDMGFVFDGRDASLPMARSALGRKLHPSEIADVIVAMTDDAMRMINGQVIVVNGGAK